jgi:hypothetical protein
VRPLHALSKRHDEHSQNSGQLAGQQGVNGQIKSLSRLYPCLQHLALGGNPCASAGQLYLAF